MGLVLFVFSALTWLILINEINRSDVNSSIFKVLIDYTSFLCFYILKKLCNNSLIFFKENLSFE